MAPEAPESGRSGQSDRPERPSDPTGSSSQRPRDPSSVESFAGDRPTRSLEEWRRLWAEDLAFPIRSHRGGLLGRLVKTVKRFLRPIVKTPQADLWDRQRVFNMILLDQIIGQRHEHRIGDLEHFVPRALDDVLHHNDALFSRVDQSLDRQRREVSSLLAALGSALAVVETAQGGTATGSAEGSGGKAGAHELVRMRDEQAYVELERRFRGTEEEIRERIAHYVPVLQDAAEHGAVLDLGCGRGESLAALADAGVPARGVDASAAMVARCLERGFVADEGDLFERLAGVAEGTLGGVVSFHVIEHLPPESLDRLVRLAYRGLAPGGALILETPNPLSVLVAARSFWLDPTHRRPVHPDSLELSVRLAGFDPVERLELRPFGADERLPELDLSSLPEEQQPLADRINRLRDRLDELLFGYQDYALVARKPKSS